MLSLLFNLILSIFFLFKIFLFNSIATLFKGILCFLIKVSIVSFSLNYKLIVTNIIIINGPNLNLLGEREQSQYGKITFNDLKNICLEHSKKIGINLDFQQSNVEGEIVTKIQNARKEYDGIIINAAGYTHTSVSIRDALEIFKKPIIELHISNIYKREEFRQKSLISNIATGIICGLGSNGYILAINAMHELLKNGNR
jgi:3-dehydroquinate dehydratase-2